MKLNGRRLTIAIGIVLVAAGAGANYAYRTAHESEEAEGLRLVVNVPANRLHVYENGVRTRTYAVSVGLKGYETPRGSYRIREVIWNPWWHPPNSGWARGRTAEPPGARNPMGRVKLNFGPLLYVHGTAEYQSLGNPASRGCIRMRNGDAIELARLVHEYASPDVSSSTLQTLIASPKMTRRIRLSRPVRLEAVYAVATVEDGFLILYPDVYGRVRSQVRSEVARTLSEHGVDMREVNRAHLDRLLEKSATRRVAIALEDLVSRKSPVGATDTDGSSER